MVVGDEVGDTTHAVSVHQQTLDSSDDKKETDGIVTKLLSIGNNIDGEKVLSLIFNSATTCNSKRSKIF